MSISIIKRAVKRAKSIIETLKKTNGLPFQDELSPELIQKQVGGMPIESAFFRQK